MTDRQENKLSMYLALLTVLGEHSAVWQTIPAFAAAKADFEAAAGEIQSLAQDQETLSAGATAQKRTLRLALADAALPVSGALVAYAGVGGDQELAGNAAVTRSDFLHQRDSAALTAGQRVHALAQTHLAALPDYGVTAPTVAALGQAVAAYAAILQRPRAVIATRAASTAQLAAAFSAADAILKKRLDPLSLAFRASAPAFYLAYEAAREIVDLSGTQSPPPAPPPNP